MLKHSNLLNTFCVFCLLMISSCSVVKRQYGYVEIVDNFSPQDYHQVLTKMGAPDSIAVLNDAYIFAYHSVSIDEPQLGLAIPSFDFFKFTLGSAIATHQYHFYAFSLNGETINLQQGNWRNALGDSSSIGLIFVVEETVDLSSFQVPRAANLWGERLLFDIDLIEFSFEEIILAKRLDLIGQPY